ncbi:MAG: 1-(5-phosphoribosyl)-5-amino-4-imidazole-carboxylate carboxylase [Anaerolineales bacterium]|nr:MAG: 1-(5-phosphoribosyl)-5-amino-4-imidazole-carboxylate carboxylase [Anaerolineales bacterium]
MDNIKIRQILTDLSNQQIDIDSALNLLRDFPYADLGYARLDSHRALRKGAGEVVFCEYKTPEQVASIFERIKQLHGKVMGTRVSAEMAKFVRLQLPEAHYDAISRLLVLQDDLPIPPDDAQPMVAVITGGTADIPVAEEAVQTLEFLGQKVVRVYDVGVAGLHRLLDQRDVLMNADVIISIAGMEGALTSVVAGLVACPVIGVPTSVGYGSSFGGLAPLLAMLNSCAPGVAVVNIDNGFGAAQMAFAILERIRVNCTKGT